LKRNGRLVCWLLAAVVCLGLLTPIPTKAAEVYFTSVNDKLLPLSQETMPLWSEGVLYVPASVFNQKSVGVETNIYSSYNRTTGTIAIFKLRQVLVFDLSKNTCWDESTGESFPDRALLRNGVPFVPVAKVCEFFDLEYSYNVIPQGYLVRIKDENVILSDTRFIDAANSMLNRRLREYTQTLEQSQQEQQGGQSQNTPSGGVSTYLAFRCSDAGQLSSVLDTLASNGRCAVFFLTPELIAREGMLVRRMVGSGHSVGIWVQEEQAERSEEILKEGARLLETIAHVRTTLAYVPQSQRIAMAEEHWICWRDSYRYVPSDRVVVNAFVADVMDRLSGRTRTTYLTFELNEGTRRVLPTLLTRLSEQRFVVRIPMETHI